MSAAKAAVKALGIAAVLELASTASEMNRDIASKFQQLSWENDTAARALRLAKAEGSIAEVAAAEEAVYDAYVSTATKQFTLMDALAKAHVISSALAHAVVG